MSSLGRKHSLLRRGLFVSQGVWGEGKKSARWLPLPIVACALILLLLSAGASAEERGCKHKNERKFCSCNTLALALMLASVGFKVLFMISFRGFHSVSLSHIQNTFPSAKFDKEVIYNLNFVHSLQKSYNFGPKEPEILKLNYGVFSLQPLFEAPKEIFFFWDINAIFMVIFVIVLCLQQGPP